MLTTLLSGEAPTWGLLAIAASFVGLYIVYLLLIAGFLAICGVSRQEIAKWALKRADRQRFSDLVSAARLLGKAKSSEPKTAPLDGTPPS